MFEVKFRKHVEKNIAKMPAKIKEKLVALVEDLQENGPIQGGWPNFSKIGEKEYHCHLSYKWVACWRNEKNSIIIEVYYAGSRENAPY